MTDLTIPCLFDEKVVDENRKIFNIKKDTYKIRQNLDTLTSRKESLKMFYRDRTWNRYKSFDRFAKKYFFLLRTSNNI